MADTTNPVPADGEEEVAVVKDPVQLMAELVVAAKTNNLEAARAVLAHENVVMPTREVDAKGRVKWGPLLWAVTKGHQQLATLLLDHGFAGPYQNAVAERAKFLQDEGDKGNILGVTTPLHWAAHKGRLITLIELIEIYRFSVSGRDERGNTPLHLAAAGAPRGDQSAPQFIKVVEVLLSEGADVHAKNYYGNTPLDLASHTDVRMLLRKVMMARQTLDTTADDAMEDEMAGLDLLSISRMREDQRNLTSLTEKVRAEMSTELLGDLEKAVADAERSFVSAAEIAVSRKVAEQLQAKRKVEDRMEMVNACVHCRPTRFSFFVFNSFYSALMQHRKRTDNGQLSRLRIECMAGPLFLGACNDTGCDRCRRAPTRCRSRTRSRRRLRRACRPTTWRAPPS
jgi:hypothetical protein